MAPLKIAPYAGKKNAQVIDGVQGENGTASGPCKAEIKNSLHHICAIQQSQVTPHFLGKKMTAIKIPLSSDITKLDSYHSLKVNQNGTETLEYTYRRGCIGNQFISL